VSTARIQDTWKRRIVAEYCSAAHTAEFLHWGIQMGLSPDTLEVARRIVGDELAHAELSRVVYLQAGGDPDALSIPPERMLLPFVPDAPVPVRFLVNLLHMFCCGETVAVPLFNALRIPTSQPDADRVLTRILQDEAVHRAFGWDTLDELLELYGDEARQLLRGHTEAAIERIQTIYTSQNTHCTDEEAAWGLMPGIRYGEIARTCVDEVIRPRLAQRGLLP